MSATGVWEGVWGRNGTEFGAKTDLTVVERGVLCKRPGSNVTRSADYRAGRVKLLRSQGMQNRLARRRAVLLRVVGATLVVAFVSAPASAAAGKPRRPIAVAIVNNNAKISARRIRTAARVLQIQANRDLRAWWPGPRVKISVTTPAAVVANPPHWLLAIDDPVPHSSTGGGHSRSPTQVIGVVFPSPGLPWTMAASHELLEMLEDPSSMATRNGYLFEVCDPVETAGYDIRGVTVSDFVTPAWFSRRRSRGPWDDLDLLNGPRRQLSAHDPA